MILFYHCISTLLELLCNVREGGSNIVMDRNKFCVYRNTNFVLPIILLLVLTHIF